MTIERRPYTHHPKASLEIEIVKLGRPILLPSHHKLRLEDSPEKMIIQFLLEARNKKQPAILREDVIAHLLPKYPYMNKETFRVHMAAVTRILKPKHCEILNKKTGVNDPQDSRRYSLITEEERLRLERETKAKENNPQSSSGLSVALTGFKEKPAEIRLESPENQQARLAREKNEISQAKEKFINNFCSVLVTRMANNVKFNSHLTTNIDRNLEEILRKSNPFGIPEKEKLRRLIGGSSMEYLQDFFVNSFTERLTQWFGVEEKDSRKVPSREQAVVQACLILKSKNITLNDVLTSIFNYLRIPAASVEKPA